MENSDNLNNTSNTSNVNKIDSINYLTLEIMANSETYNKYLKKNNLDHDTVLKKEKRFYRKRITAMAKDIINNNINNNIDSPIDDIITNAFNTFARLCVSHFKFKDTMDTIQGDYKDMVTGNIVNDANLCSDLEFIEYNKNTIDEANKLFMKQVDKKVVTMDNFVIKTSPPQDEMILPKTKDFNLKDPKYKKKDIKRGHSTGAGVKWADTNNIINVKVTKKEKSDIEVSISSE
uniref:Uncharacterized protein n=1 Tax=viral metagenome TaxID=1070528 RepID=A0A6C0F2P9_9ZZZZ